MIETIFTILAYLLGAYILFLMLLAAIAYWPYTLFIIGVILVNVFTMWSSIGLFLIATGLQAYGLYKDNSLTAKVFFQKVLLNSMKLTMAVVLFCLVLNAVFSSLGGGGNCSRGTPGGC